MGLARRSLVTFLLKVCRLGGSGLQWRTITPDTLIRFMLSTVSIEDALASGLLN